MAGLKEFGCFPSRLVLGKRTRFGPCADSPLLARRLLSALLLCLLEGINTVTYKL
jgi:hypothetical protein